MSRTPFTLCLLIALIATPFVSPATASNHETESEPNNTKAQANTISEPVDAVIDDEDVDWFRHDAAAGEYVVFRTRFGDMGVFPYWLTLKLFGPDGDLVDVRLGTGPEVSAYSAVGGTYKLKIVRSRAPSKQPTLYEVAAFSAPPPEDPYWWPTDFFRSDYYDLDVRDGPDAEDVGVAELTGDGRKDLVLTMTDWNATKARLVVLARNGDGMLGRLRSYPMTRYGVNRLTTGDVDDDGDPDVVTATDAGWRIYEQRNGRLLDPQLIRTPWRAFNVRLHDMDRDGRTDAVVATRRGIYIYERRRGEWDGKRVIKQAHGDIEVGNVVGTKLPDVIGNRVDGLRVYRATDPAKFGFPQTLPIGDVDDADLGDIDGDGRRDIVATNLEESYVIKGRAVNTLGEPWAVVDPVGWYVKARDLNEDGRAEIIGGRSVLYLDEDGHMERHTLLNWHLGGTATVMNVGDLDGDGLLDVVTTSAGGDFAVSRNGFPL